MCRVSYFLWSLHFPPTMRTFERLTDGDELQVLTAVEVGGVVSHVPSPGSSATLVTC